MKGISQNVRLLLVFILMLGTTLLLHFRFSGSRQLPESGQMEKAVEQARAWFRIIEKEKKVRGIVSDSRSRVANSFMLGDDFTMMTTTLGSLEAKEISTNPDFAALVVRLLHEADCKKGDRAGILLSGSFPALAVSTLAAMQVMEMEVVMMSSLGASSFGANQPGATWIDMEGWLNREDMPYSSMLVSPGAENDNGGGMTGEGMEQVRRAAERNNRSLYMPSDLQESITHKSGVLKQEGIRVLVNIGGNQSAVGGCVHASTLPNDLHNTLKSCNCPDRGIIREINALGIPVIHLLNIRDLASGYGMDPAPGKEYARSLYLYQTRETNRAALLISLSVSLLAMFFLLHKKSSQ